MTIENAGKKWRALHEQWHVAEHAARKARSAVIFSLTEGKSGRPSIDVLSRLQRLERVADEARAAEKGHLDRFFG